WPSIWVPGCRIASVRCARLLRHWLLSCLVWDLGSKPGADCPVCRERPCSQINIRNANAHPASSVLPLIDNHDYLIHYLPGLYIAQPIKSGRAEDSLKTRSIIHVVNIQNMLCLVDIRIDVKRG